MLLKFKLIIIILFLPSFSNAIFKEQEWPILRVISEPENEIVYKVNLILNDFEEINRVEVKGPNGNDFFIFNEIIRGIVILKKENRDILFLECPNCDKAYGGEIEIKFLKNAIRNQYSEVFFDLRKTEGKWGVFYPDSKNPIRSIRLKSNKLLGNIIGIKEIEVNPK